MRYVNSNAATTQTNNVKVNVCFACKDICARFLTSRNLCASKLSAVTLGSLAISKPFRWTTNEKRSRLFKPQLRRPNYLSTLYS